MVYLAIDVGTESLRAGLIGPDGRLLASARQAYPTAYPAAPLGRTESG